MLQPTAEMLLSSATARRAGASYVCVLVLAALLPVAAVSIINFAVDPFQFFRKHERPKFSRTMMLHQMPGVIRNYDFDAAVVGNSLGGNLLPPYFPHYKFQNLIAFGATLNETAEIAKLVLRKKQLKVLFWTTGYQDIRNDYRFRIFLTACTRLGWNDFRSATC